MKSPITLHRTADGKSGVRRKVLASSFDLYLDHFKLTAEPFSLTPDPDFLYLSPAHAEALAALKVGVTRPRG